MSATKSTAVKVRSKSNIQFSCFQTTSYHQMQRQIKRCRTGLKSMHAIFYEASQTDNAGRLKTARGLLRVITDDFGCGRLLYRVTQNRFELFHGGAVQVVKINFPMVIAVALQAFLIAETVQFGKRGGFVVKRALMQDAHAFAFGHPFKPYFVVKRIRLFDPDLFQSRSPHFCVFRRQIPSKG